MRWFYRLGLGAVVLFIAFVATIGLLIKPDSNAPLGSVELGDGRTIHVEKVSYGREHSIGRPRSKLTNWLIYQLPRYITKHIRDRPAARFSTEQDALVIWVDATDTRYGTNVDCQAIRLELVDKNGDKFGEETSSWFGGQDFWRVGHVFYAYPRNESQLKLTIVPWKGNGAGTVSLPNPHIVSAKNWSGSPPPLTSIVENLEVKLSALELRTNGGPKKYWEVQSRYFEPVFELGHDGQPAAGWRKPEWIAEDSTGNRSEHLGTHQPVLKFSAIFWPYATNPGAATLLCTLPEAAISGVTNISWWNKEVDDGTNRLTVLGLFPKGVNIFLGGEYQTNPPVSMRPVTGGAPSGWVGQGVANPLKEQYYHGHYTPEPVIYLRVKTANPDTKLAVRLRDAEGKYWETKLESQGTPDGIYPFLLSAPPGVTNATPEVVLLKSVKAEFMVQTPKTPP